MKRRVPASAERSSNRAEVARWGRNRKKPAKTGNETTAGRQRTGVRAGAEARGLPENVQTAETAPCFVACTASLATA